MLSIWWGDGSGVCADVLVCFRMCGATTRVARSDSLSVSCMMMRRDLRGNQISSLKAGTFARLGNLNEL